MLWLLVLLGMPAAAEIYRWRDTAGEIHYSDRPHVDARPVQVDPGYTYYHVKRVYDGDTILLQNRLKVRFLGINTPEVEGRNKLAEAGGEQAKQWLQKALSGRKVRLQYDVDKKDKYGRSLAQVFTDEGLHVNWQLVREGLAIASIHPPNLRYSEELLAAQRQAQAEKLGIWGYPEYAVKPIESLPKGQRKGWQRLTGRVIRVSNSRKFSYLEFSRRIDARIERRFLYLFPDLQQYVGRDIVISGWPSRRKGHYSILLRHPSAIEVLH